MDAGNPGIIDRVDASSLVISKDLEIVSLAMSGAYELQMASQPNLRGLQGFLFQADEITRRAETTASAELARAQDALTSALGAFPEANALPNSQGAIDAPGLRRAATSALTNVHQQIKLVLASRFREQLVSAGAPRSQQMADLRVAIRNGAMVRGAELQYLIIRKALLDHVNATRIAQLRAAGAVRAQVIHTVPNHSTDGMIFTLIGEEGFTTYADLCAAGIFHPRSNAIVGAL